MSTTFEIGRWPAAISRAFSHAGDSPMRDVLEHAGGEPRAQVGALDGDRAPVGDLPRRAGILAPGRRRQRRAGGGMRLPGHPVDAEAVGPVGRDLERQHIGGDRQHLGQRRAGGQRIVEHHDPVVVGADRELVLGQDHPVRALAAELGHLQLGAVGHDRPRLGHRDRLAGGDVGRAADDLGRLGAVAGVHLADAAAGRRRGAGPPRRTLPTTKFSSAATPWCSIRSTSVPVIASRSASAAVLELGRAVLVQPLDRDAHGLRTAPGSGCRCRRTAAGRGRRA